MRQHECREYVTRPRDRERILEDPDYYKLRNYILDYLYHRYAHSE